MKKLFLFAALSAVLMVSGAGASSIRDGSSPAGEPAGIEGKKWKLTAVSVDGSDPGFSRGKLPNDEIENIYTLSFDGKIVSGKGAPNLYSAPYTLDGESISIKLMRSTMMATFREPEGLGEHDFLTYIQNSYRWELDGPTLRLYSKTAAAEVTLIFS